MNSHYLYFLGKVYETYLFYWNLFRNKTQVMFLYGTGFEDLVDIQILNKHRRISEFIIDKTIIQTKDHHFWSWICINQ